MISFVITLVQKAPPSAVLNNPLTGLPVYCPEHALFPVAAKRICGLVGCILRLPTYRSVNPLLIGVQVPPPSVLFKTPTPPGRLFVQSELYASRSKIPVDRYRISGLVGLIIRYLARLSPCQIRLQDSPPSVVLYTRPFTRLNSHPFTSVGISA